MAYLGGIFNRNRQTLPEFFPTSGINTGTAVNPWEGSANQMPEFFPVDNNNEAPPEEAPAGTPPMMMYSQPNMTGGGYGGGRNQELMGGGFGGGQMMTPMPNWLYDKWQPMHQQLQDTLNSRYPPGFLAEVMRKMFSAGG